MKKELLLMLLLALIGLTGISQTAVAQTPEPNEVVEIATAEDMNSFASLVGAGVAVDGVLTADIDLTQSDNPNLMIGTESNPFNGKFNGQGHTVTYSYMDVENYGGLFSYLGDATISNLYVKGDACVKGIHFGALMGRVDGTVLVENVVTDVDIIGERSGVTGDAGMVGALYGKVTFNNCATLGEMGNPGSSMYCGYTAWASDAGVSTLNNCFTACLLTEGTGLDYCYTFCRGTCQLNNCYYLNAIGTVQGKPITEAQIASGSLCYKLNGDQSVISWTQTIGTDPTPVPGTGSLRVYASGTLRCDGTEMEDNPLDYSNTESYPIIPDHQFGDDGICTVCGTPDPDAVKKNEDGYYLIGSPKQLNWLVLRIEQGEEDAKVLLTDDIDLSNGEFSDLMIATEEHPFRGIFDGGGYTITYDYGYVSEKWRGLFRSVNDATIRNLRVEGEAIPTNIHYGALIGVAYGTVLVENVVTNVHITGDHSGVTGDAGMVGANYAHMTFNNCATLGEMGNPGSSMYSSFSGWSHGDSYTILNNCYTACHLTEDTGLSSCFTLTHSNGHVTLNNCYYLHEIGRVQGIAFDEEQMESGELCYKLNGDQSEIGWYQNIGDDETPVPDASHLRVYGAGQTFMNITDDASFRDFVSLVLAEEKEFYEETIAQKSLVETYLTALEGLSEAADIETFMAGYDELSEQRQSIKSCAEAYAAYMAKVEEVKLYMEEHPELDNEKAQLLKNYLTEYEEPSEDYPNGSAEYIVENGLLSEEEIIAETALVEEKLVEAITSAPAAGTEITMLFTNADLSDQFNGWEGQLPTGWGGSETSPLYAAECLGAKMDMYQTLTGLPNGIYELRVNGAFRPTPYNDFYNVNYAATLYANGIHNYFQTNIEDMIDVEDAIDGVNCNINGPVADFAIEDEDGELIGYTMQGIVSCCNAFQAGRYANSVLCNVTDGTLTIGIRQPGTGLSRDWLGFGNIKVTYFGQLNDAAESLDRVLASMSDRAYTILNVYEFDYTDNYAVYPNFSQALKDELQQTLDAVATASQPEAKFQLIEKFSSLFLQIYESKQAYVTLMDKAEELNSLLSAFSSLLSDDEFNRLEDLYAMLTNGYIDGSFTTEEVLAIDLKKEITFYPDEEDGYYLLRNDRDFYVFASMVSGGSTNINAKLMTDIDLRESDYADTMIGIEEAQFAGIFDGQGHTVTYSYTVDDNYCGLFRFTNGATIRNLRVEGDAVVTAIHFGALAGYVNGTTLIENVITNVNITGDRGGVTGDGGMFGRLEGDVTFNNCATMGEMGNPGSSMYCGFVAYAGSGSSTLNNCYTTCTLTEGTGTDYCYTFCRGTYKANNCYYLNAIGTAQGTQMSLDKFQNGEVCYKLNGDQSVLNWYQTLGEDEFPVLNASHQIVILEDGKYGNPDAINEISADDRQQFSGIYNLAGQRISKLQKGINIVNGKKIIVK